MSKSPSAYLSRLSLQATPSPPLQPSSPMQSMSKSLSPHHSALSSDEDDSEWEDDVEDTVLSESTGLRYNIGHLSPRTQKVVRGLFNNQESPQIYLDSCGIREEGSEGGNVFYAFQMHEVVPCSVRIGSRSSTQWSIPRCTCPDARYRRRRPCKHLVWLFDRISKQTLVDDDPDSPLTMDELGYPEELGDPFNQISDLRLDVLADGLRCDIIAPNTDTAPPNGSRVREAREIVATLAGIQPREVDTFRPDLEASYRSNTLIRRGDLEATLFSLLLASHSLAASVRAQLAPPDPAVDPFRALHQRALRVISELNAYTVSIHDPSLAASWNAEGKGAEGPRDVDWAVSQILNVVARIKRSVSRGSRPLSSSERASAARALVGILKSVASHKIDLRTKKGRVEDRSLYLRLVGTQDNGFVYSALDTLVDQSQFVEELEAVMEMIGRFGAPESYAYNMRGLITRMRSHTGSESRRSSVTFATEPSVPRSATPPLEGVLSAPDPETGLRRPLSSGDGQFLVPETPASASRARGRGSRGGRGGSSSQPESSSTAGSKRSVSGTSERGRGSKRPR
ncbi:hypothetical protein B0T16DRAFT_386016 [Cercophora newfieldiana]|uniref:SWIM-type domain-containing protein n=1 Tax=Cercophora newfieldiana TaxID=92897 RepID=A0AA40D0Q2_9PEZI|nr:hypothetical protein B0T16DRAFT_386016 [Cercophora newfieldiana]